MDLSAIKITKNSKNIGPGCRYSLDIVRGCKNKCIGCYARAIYYQGPKEEFDQPHLLRLDKKTLMRQLINFSKKETPIVRIGVNSEPCVYIPNLRKVINLCNKNNVGTILISKNIIYFKDLAEIMKRAKTILHISLGMISNAPRDEKKLREAERYEKFGVQVVYRIIDDITESPNSFFKKIINKHKYILATPLRLRSYEVAATYKINLNNYTFCKGYFRPNFINRGWHKKNVQFCGEIIKNNTPKILCGDCCYKIK